MDSTALSRPQIERWPRLGEGTADIPTRGHYCFVGVLGNAQHSAPDQTAVSSDNDFDLIGEDNSVVWKDFDQDNLSAGGYTQVGFCLHGRQIHRHRGDLEIDLSALSAGVQVERRT